MSDISTVPADLPVGEPSLGLGDVVGVLARRKWIVIGLALVVTVASLISSSRQPTTYSSSATIMLAGGAQSTVEAQQSMATAKRLAESRTVAAIVVDRLQRPESSQELLKGLSVSVPLGTQLVEFQYTSARGEDAMALAQGFADAFRKYQGQLLDRLVSSSQALDVLADDLRDQLATAETELASAQDPADVVTARLEADSLTDQLRTVEQQRSALLGSAPIVSSEAERASPAELNTPSLKRGGVVGLAAGLVFGSAVAFRARGEGSPPKGKALRRVQDHGRPWAPPRRSRRRSSRRPREQSAGARHGNNVRAGTGASSAGEWLQRRTIGSGRSGMVAQPPMGCPLTPTRRAARARRRTPPRALVDGDTTMSRATSTERPTSRRRQPDSESEELMDTRTNREHWDGLGERYTLNWEGDSRQVTSRKERDFVARHVPPASGNAVLDVGVGNGRILESLLLLSSVSDVYGIDIAPSMVDLCHDRHGQDPRVRLLTLCDVATEALPIDVPLQFISAVRVLKYLPNWWDIVADKLIAQLAPGGVLVFSMPNRRSAKRLSRSYAVDYETTTEDDLRARLTSIGVSVVDVAGFTKLPDLLHRRCTRQWSSRLVMRAEEMLAIALGDATLSTELFVAAQRNE